MCSRRSNAAAIYYIPAGVWLLSVCFNFTLAAGPPAKNVYTLPLDNLTYLYGAEALAVSDDGPLPPGTPQLNRKISGPLKFVSRNFPTRSGQNAWSLPVRVLDWAPGLENVTRDEDQLDIYRENMDPDFAPWEAKKKLTMADLIALTKARRYSYATVRVVLIRRNQLYFVSQRDTITRCTSPCDRMLKSFEGYMHHAMKMIQFPDVVFLFNVYDMPLCKGGGRSNCPAPPISHIKAWSDDRKDLDILVPLLQDVIGKLYRFPWNDKIEMGFLRATPYKEYHQGFQPSARIYLARSTYYDGRNASLEAALTTGYKGPENSSFPVPAFGMFPMPDHARYKYLLNTDGNSASYRLSKIMHTNSLVVKQSSPYIEWFYRSIRSGVHYTDFWTTSKDDVFDVLEQLKKQDAEMRTIAEAGQRFAYKYTSLDARMLYWKRALERYKALFDSSMDEFIANLTLGPSLHDVFYLPVGSGLGARQGGLQIGGSGTWQDQHPVKVSWEVPADQTADEEEWQSKVVAMAGQDGTITQGVDRSWVMMHTKVTWEEGSPATTPAAAAAAAVTAPSGAPMSDSGGGSGGNGGGTANAIGNSPDLASALLGVSAGSNPADQNNRAANSTSTVEAAAAAAGPHAAGAGQLAGGAGVVPGAAPGALSPAGNGPGGKPGEAAAGSGSTAPEPAWMRAHAEKVKWS